MFPGHFGKDFSYNPNSEEKEAYQFYRYPVNWVVISWFLGFALVVFFIYQTMITIDTTFHYFLIFGVVATLVHYFITSPRKPKMLPIMAFYNFFGVAALACGIFLTMNYTLRGDTVSKTVEVQEINKNRNYGKQMNQSEVKLDDPNIEAYKYLIDFSQWDYQEFREAGRIEIFISKGLFGYKIYEDAKLLEN